MGLNYKMGSSAAIIITRINQPALSKFKICLNFVNRFYFTLEPNESESIGVKLAAECFE